MSTTHEPRTEPAKIDYYPHPELLERYAGPMDDSIARGTVEPCPECGSRSADGWMSSGATCIRAKCILCGTQYVPEPGNGNE